MIQPLSYIHPEAKIAPNVVIEPFSTIHRDVVIGEGTWNHKTSSLRGKLPRRRSVTTLPFGSV